MDQKLEKMIKQFTEKTGISPTFYNKFIDAYSFCYSYRYRGIKKNMSFIVMKEEGEIVSISKFSMFKQKKAYIKTLADLEKIFDLFIHVAEKNDELVIEGA